MLRDLSIKHRLTALGAVLSLLCVVAGLQGLVELGRANHDLEKVYVEHVVPLRQIKAFSDLYAVDIVDHAQKANLGLLSPDSALRTVRAARLASDSLWLSYRSYSTAEEGRLVGVMYGLKESADSSVARLDAILAAGDRAALAGYVGSDMYAHIDPVTAKLNRLSDIQEVEAHRVYDEATARYDATWRRVMVTIVVGLLLCAVLCWHVIRGITRPLEQAVGAARRLAVGDVDTHIAAHRGDEVGTLLDAMREVVESERAMAETAERIAAGDLSASVAPRSAGDRLGNAFGVMAARLREIIGEVRAGAEGLAAAASQVAATTEALSHGAEQQVLAVDGTRRELEGMGERTSRNADHAKETEALAGHAATQAEESARAVREALRAMRAIADRTEVVGEIAAQTNTLALVAGIEAARAGDAGRGFAEIASEVRKLSDRSREAAAEITRLTGLIQSAGEGLGDRLGALVPEIGRTSALVREVGVACREQEAGAATIGRSMDGLHGIALETAASTQELASTAEELAAQAHSLQGLVAFFRTAEPAPAAPAGILSPLPPLPPRESLFAPAPAVGAEEEAGDFTLRVM